jgi:hypothetical protein
MSYLLYCIFRRHKGQNSEPLPGVDGQPVLLIEAGGLAAATSLAPVHPTPTPAQILTYARVIEVLHRASPTGGVIPMRYGNLFAEEAGIGRYLTDRLQEHARLLQQVEGFEEMGIRLLLPSPASPASHRSPQQAGRNGQAGSFGKAYLADRRAHYAEANRVSEELHRRADHCREALAGLFVNSVAKRRTVRDPQTQMPKVLLSLDFLVPRAAVPRFRLRFRDLCRTGPTQLLLSGPWPPYNFVLPKPDLPEHAMCSGRAETPWGT